MLATMRPGEAMVDDDHIPLSDERFWRLTNVGEGRQRAVSDGGVALGSARRALTPTLTLEAAVALALSLAPVPPSP